MSDAIYPDLPGLAWPVVKTPELKSLKQTSASGKEKSAALWTYPKWHFKLSYEHLRDNTTQESVFKTIVGFYLQRYGSHDDFLFFDKSDHLATNQPIGIGDGVTTEFQLLRTFGGFTEPVFGLDIKEEYSFLSPVFVVKTRPAVFINGVMQNGGFALDAGAKLVFAVPPALGAIITATFRFYYRVKFKNDMQDFENFLYMLWSAKTVELVSQK